MARRKMYYMVFDCETATLPFANEIAQGNAEIKKRIAIARPLIYDAGWTICDRAGNIIDRKQFLVAETFSVPQVFNTAYYKEKRPIYLEMLRNGETTVQPWNVVIQALINDLERVDAVGAFNSMFDFKKAIPFTELYIRKLYSEDYFAWEAIQRRIAQSIADGHKSDPDPNFEPDVFRFRGKAYPLFDLWGLSVSHLLNNVSYKTECLRHNLLTNSGTFFKSSAESTYQYLCDKYDFVEAHTALEDALIETFILSKIAQRHAITIGIQYFPFRDLGYTYDFVQRRKRPVMEEVETVYNAMARYVDAKMELASAEEDLSNYARGLIRQMGRLAKYGGFDCHY